MKQMAITLVAVVLVIAAIVSGCICTYVSNQTEIQRGVERLLDERINEYVEKNKTEFVASLTPVIGANGNWWIGDTDTGCPVTVEGQPGMSAYAVAVANGYQGTETEWLNSLQGSNGADGQTPYISENGNWWIGTEDTGCKAAADASATSNLYRHCVTVYAKKTDASVALKYIFFNSKSDAYNTSEFIDYMKTDKSLRYTCTGLIDKGDNCYIPDDAQISVISADNWMLLINYRDSYSTSGASVFFTKDQVTIDYDHVSEVL